MKREDAKEAIVREWLALPPQDRATKTHARLFAISKAGEYRFRSAEDRADMIESRLLEHVGDRRAAGSDAGYPVSAFADLPLVALGRTEPASPASSSPCDPRPPKPDRSPFCARWRSRRDSTSNARP
jgi:hypothetical protein